METRYDRTNRKVATEPAQDGCQVYPNCLECPLPICIMDMTPLEARRTVQEHKAELIERQVKAMMKQGLTSRQAVIRMAKHLGVKNTCNIYRRLKKHREKKLAGAAALHQFQRDQPQRE